MKFKVTIKPSENFKAESMTINAISIYEAVIFADDMLRAAGATPCDI